MNNILAKIYRIPMLLLMLVAISGSAYASKAVFSVKSGSSVNANTDFAINLILSNFEEGYDPEPALADAQFGNCKFRSVKAMHHSTSTTTIGGKTTVSTEVTYQVVFTSGKKGVCTIGPVDFDGTESNTATIEILTGKPKQQKSQSQNKSAGNKRNTYYLVPYLSAESAEVGESVVYELRLLTADQNIIDKTEISIVKEPVFEDMDSRQVGTYGTGSTGYMTYNGKQYPYEVAARWILTPLKEKNLTIKGGEYTLDIIPIKLYSSFWGTEYAPDYDSSYTEKKKVSSLKLKVKGYKKPDKKPGKSERETPDKTNDAGEPVYNI